MDSSSNFQIFQSFSKILGTVTSVVITTGVTINLIIHNCFSSLARYQYLPIFSFIIILKKSFFGLLERQNSQDNNHIVTQY